MESSAKLEPDESVPEATDEPLCTRTQQEELAPEQPVANVETTASSTVGSQEHGDSNKPDEEHDQPEIRSSSSSMDDTQQRDEDGAEKEAAALFQFQAQLREMQAELTELHKFREDVMKARTANEFSPAKLAAGIVALLVCAAAIGVALFQKIGKG